MSMDTNKKLIILGMAVLLLAVGLSGCTTRLSPEMNIDDRFVGTWEGEDELGDNVSIIYFSDGTFNTNYGERGEYELKDEKLVMIVMTGDLKAVLTYNYAFSNDNTTLSLTELSVNETIAYTRQ